MQEKQDIKEGTVVEALKGATFRVLFDDGETTALATISGKMRLHYIRVLVGDRVQMQMDPYDSQRGRIIKRL
ncbi:MAG: translation initiation factor IF-1 [Patescibacteria group bacterium]|jgi:translation initiation factor IF-1